MLTNLTLPLALRGSAVPPENVGQLIGAERLPGWGREQQGGMIRHQAALALNFQHELEGLPRGGTDRFCRKVILL